MPAKRPRPQVPLGDSYPTFPDRDQSAERLLLRDFLSTCVDAELAADLEAVLTSGGLGLALRLLDNALHRALIASRFRWLQNELPWTRQGLNRTHRQLFAYGVLQVFLGTGPKDQRLGIWRDNDSSLLAQDMRMAFLKHIDWTAIDWEALLADCAAIAMPTLEILCRSRPAITDPPSFAEMCPRWCRERPWWWFRDRVNARPRLPQSAQEYAKECANDQENLNDLMQASPEAIILRGLRRAREFGVLPDGVAERMPPPIRHVLEKQIEDETRRENEKLSKQLGSLIPVSDLDDLSRTYPMALVKRPSQPLDRSWWTAALDPKCADPPLHLEETQEAVAIMPPAECFASAAAAIRDLVASGADPFPRLGLIMWFFRMALRQRNSAWRPWFHFQADPAYRHVSHGFSGTQEAAEAARPFVAALWGKDPLYHSAIATHVRRSWLAVWLHWAGGAGSEDERRGRITSALASLAWRDGDKPHDEVERARKALYEVQINARDGADLPAWSRVEIPHEPPEIVIGVCLDLIALARPPIQAMKALVLILRELTRPAVPDSLATNQMPDLGLTDCRPWDCIPALGMALITQVHARGPEAKQDFIDGFAEILTDRLKPLAAKDKGKAAPGKKPRIAPRSQQPPPHLSGGYHPDMLEPSAVWRRGYVLALGELAFKDSQPISRILDHVRTSDPDPGVQEVAGTAQGDLKERSAGRAEFSPTRLLMHAWWRLRWSHRLSIGQSVDATAAHRTRLQEIRRFDQI